MAIKTVMLKGKALGRFTDYETQRASITAQVEALLAQDDENRTAMFRGIAEDLGLDLRQTSWTIDEGHREEFGVVLLKGEVHNPLTVAAVAADAEDDDARDDGVLLAGDDRGVEDVGLPRRAN